MRTLVLLLTLASGAVGVGPAAAYCVDIFGTCEPVWSGVCEYCDVEGVCVVEGGGGGAMWCRASGVVCWESGYSDATKTCTPAN